MGRLLLDVVCSGRDDGDPLLLGDVRSGRGSFDAKGLKCRPLDLDLRRKGVRKRASHRFVASEGAPNYYTTHLQDPTLSATRCSHTTTQRYEKHVFLKHAAIIGTLPIHTTHYLDDVSGVRAVWVGELGVNNKQGRAIEQVHDAEVPSPTTTSPRARRENYNIPIPGRRDFCVVYLLDCPPLLVVYP
jgi:hypothetical protein